MKEEYVGIPIKTQRGKTKTHVLLNETESDSENEPTKDNIHTFNIVTPSDDELEKQPTRSKSKVKN